MPTKKSSPAKNATKPTKASAKPTPKKTPAKKIALSWKPVGAIQKANPEPNPLKSLNLREQSFVREYLIDLNATQAAIRAGYSERTAGSQAHDLLKKPEISWEIRVAMESRAEKTGISAERVIKEAARLAFFDVRKLVDKDGNPLPIQDLDDDTAAAISGLDIQEVKLGETGAIAVVKKYKIADKNAALERLFKHLGLFEKDNNQKVDPIAALLAAMGKSSIPIVKTPGND